MSEQAFKVCFFFKRIFKLRVAKPPEEIKQLFDQFSENGTMSVDNLLKFMIYYQKEETAEKEASISMPSFGISISPLAHYFLYTGHNSYLTGNQLSSHSSSKPIIQALRRGVKSN
ncbi:hypothetical protein AB3S75_041180 [Citrus x aurantiifolia]